MSRRDGTLTVVWSWSRGKGRKERGKWWEGGRKDRSGLLYVRICILIVTEKVLIGVHTHTTHLTPTHTHTSPHTYTHIHTHAHAPHIHEHKHNTPHTHLTPQTYTHTHAHTLHTGLSQALSC